MAKATTATDSDSLRELIDDLDEELMSAHAAGLKAELNELETLQEKFEEEGQTSHPAYFDIQERIDVIKRDLNTIPLAY